MSEPRPLSVRLATEVVATGSGPETRDRQLDVLTKLRAGLGKLIGVHGFDVLLGRALILTQRAEPHLQAATVDPSGVLTGFSGESSEAERSLVALLSHCFELLSRFIGDALVVRAVRDACPGVGVPKEANS